MATARRSPDGGVFISYSHKDKRWRDELETHLKPYIRTGSISAWSDKQIKPGTKWLDQLRAALASAKVAVLLVTPNFLDSDFIDKEELVPSLKEAESGGLRLLWIPVRPSSYQQSALRNYQAVVNPEKPLASMRRPQRDTAWVEVCKEIERVLKVGMSERMGPPSPDPILAIPSTVETQGILVVYGTWDEKWREILSTHLDVPCQLDLVEFWKGPSARTRRNWLPRFERAVKSSCAVVFLLSPEFAASDLASSDELDAIIKAAVENRSLKVLPLMMSSCTGVNLPRWLRFARETVSEKRLQGDQSGEGRGRLTKHAACAKIATQVAAAVSESERWSFMSETDLVQFCQWRTRERILLSSTWVDIAFYWDLFALPIQCQRYSRRAHSSPALRCEELLLRGGRRILLLGAPASGKTTASKRLEAYPPAKTIVLRVGNRIPDTVRSVVDRLSSKECTGIKNQAFLKEQIHRGNILLVADGISEHRDMAATVTGLQTLSMQLPRIRFLVTCRTEAYKNFGETWFPRFKKWVITDLNWRSRARFLANQEKGVQMRVRKAFRKEPELRKMCRNQFIFLMVVMLIARKGREELDLTRAKIYEDFLQEFLGRWEGLSRWERETIEGFLKELAVDMRRFGPKRSNACEDRVKQLLRSSLGVTSAQELEKELRHVLHLGLVKKEGQMIHFFQETFQEFLCAKWLCEKQDISFPINTMICSFHNEIGGFGKTVE